MQKTRNRTGPKASGKAGAPKGKASRKPGTGNGPRREDRPNDRKQSPARGKRPGAANPHRAESAKPPRAGAPKETRPEGERAQGGEERSRPQAPKRPRIEDAKELRRPRPARATRPRSDAAKNAPPGPPQHPKRPRSQRAAEREKARRLEAAPQPVTSPAKRTEQAKPSKPEPQRPPRPTADARAKLAARRAEERGEEAEPLGPSRSGTVALVGRPNVGKSTLLNAALEQPLAIVTSTPQTTRDSILGVVHVGSSEVVLLDTPGLHKARSALSRSMNRTARSAAKSADVVVFVTDIPIRTDKESRGPLRPMPGDLALLTDIGQGQPTILVINKIDRARDKGALLPLIEALSQVRSFEAIVPISALRENGVLRVLAEVSKLLPEGPHRYGADDITDRPSRFFAAEYVREQVLLATKEEVPHATAVTIDAFEEKPKVMRISATIHVERSGQKKILVGTGGQMLKEIGTKARQRIQALLECPVYLELFVRVTPGWRESPRLLEELGYGDSEPDGRNEQAMPESDDEADESDDLEVLS